MHLYPTHGRVVIDPVTGEPLPAEGARVQPSQYWLRRLKDRDVTVSKPKQKKPRTNAK